MNRAKPMALAAGVAKPFVWFGRADDTLVDADVAVLRGRLVRELAHVLSYMAMSDLEKPNEPVVVLFTRLTPDVMRSSLLLPPASASSPQRTAAPGGGGLSAPEIARLKGLRRALEEARGTLNPRFLMLVSVQQPWSWTFVFLRSHERLRPALHRLAPAAAQLVVDRRVLPSPVLVTLDDLTPGADVLARLRHRVAQGLRPLLIWMGEEDMEGDERRPERVPVLYVATDVDLLAQRFVAATESPPPPPVPLTASGEEAADPLAEASADTSASMEGRDEAAAARRGRGVLPTPVTAGGDAAEAAATALHLGWTPVCPGLTDLTDAEMQRMLLARDRMYDLIEVMRPRLLVLVNWLRPAQWVIVLCRKYTRLLMGMAEVLPDRTVYVWAARRLPRPTDSLLTDVCYSNSCPRRGQIQQGVMYCPKCLTAKYCGIQCQSEHWKAGHCRLCPRLIESKLGRGGGPGAGGLARSGGNVRASLQSLHSAVSS